MDIWWTIFGILGAAWLIFRFIGPHRWAHKTGMAALGSLGLGALTRAPEEVAEKTRIGLAMGAELISELASALGRFVAALGG
jgi:hypothetical protein